MSDVLDSLQAVSECSFALTYSRLFPVDELGRPLNITNSIRNWIESVIFDAPFHIPLPVLKAFVYLYGDIASSEQNIQD